MIKSVFIAALVITMLGSVVNAEMIRISDKEVVYDSDTKLMWQDNSDSKTVKKKWSAAIDYCENLSFAGYDDWKLPYKDTLKALYPKKSSLQNLVLDLYWTSTTSSRDTITSRVIYFDDGDDGLILQHSPYYVRCVRSGNFFDPLIIEFEKKAKAKQIEAQRIVELKQKEDNDWNNASSLNTISAYKAYLKQYPNGAYVSNAKENLYELSPARIAQRKKEAQERAIREAREAKERQAREAREAQYRRDHPRYITNVYDYSSSYANRDNIDTKGLKYSDGSSGGFFVKRSSMSGCIDLTVISNGSGITGSATSCDNAHNYWAYYSCGNGQKSGKGSYGDIVERIVDECK